jgi:hypothetical protein
MRLLSLNPKLFFAWFQGRREERADEGADE